MMLNEGHAKYEVSAVQEWSMNCIDKLHCEVFDESGLILQSPKHRSYRGTY